MGDFNLLFFDLNRVNLALMTKSDHSFYSHVFPSGLRLLVTPMKSAKSITVLVMVATGSRYETKNINGISHFLEHMMFKGTAKRPGNMDISRELDSIGADYNAFTSKEYTGYYVKCAAEKTDTALDVISDIFQNSKLDAKEIEKEKGVIIEEINMYLDMPQRYVHDIFEELLYGDQPLGWQVAGEKEIIKSLNRDNFVDYFNTHYFDKNTVIAVAGKVEPEKIKEKIGIYFNNIRAGAKPLGFVKATEDQTKPRIKVFNKKTDQTHFVLGFRAYNYFDDRRDALKAMSLILAGGMSSRLWEEFREKHGLAYYFSANNNPYNDVGFFAVNAGVDNGRFHQALEIALKQCQRLAAEPVKEAELEKIKDHARGRLAISLESSDDLASFYAEQELLKRKIEAPEQKLARLEKVTIGEIQKVAKEVFRPERLNLAFIGPLEENDPKVQKILNTW